MTRKHFQAIAETLRNISDYETRRIVAHELAAVFEGLNPRFDYARFYRAAGV